MWYKYEFEAQFQENRVQYAVNFDFILLPDIDFIKVRLVGLISSLSLATISESTITSGKKTLKMASS